MKKNVKKSTIKFLEKQFNLYMYTSIILAIIMVAIGLVLYIKPTFAIKTVSWVTGIFFLIQGCLSIYSYFKRNHISLLSFNLIYGILSAIIGIFVITNPFAIANILTIGLGIWLAISGALKIDYARRLYVVKEAAWLLTLVIGIISILFGFMVILNPFSKLIIVEVIGLFFIVYGIIDFTDILLLKNRAKHFVNIFK